MLAGDVHVEGLAGYLTIAQAAKVLGITPSGVHKLVRRKNLPVVRVGQTVLVKLSVLQAAR